jgi:hypothetical protein
MATHPQTISASELRRNPPRLGKGARTLAIALAVSGILALVVSLLLALNDHANLTHLYFSYLLGLCYAVSLAVGSLIFTMTQYIMKASWSVIIRRIAESAGATIPALLLLAIPVVILVATGHYGPFKWLDPELSTIGSGHFDALVAHKKPYLNLGFFIIRWAAIFIIWAILAWRYRSRSIKQDQSGNAGITQYLARLSAPGLVLMAVTITLFAVDALMSLDPHWFSTIFGVYFFAGSFLATIAFMTLVALTLESRHILKNIITTEHYHDLGKLMFAFTLFWGYIAFSQYMLIWYANIPETTAWYLLRQQGGWLVVTIVLLFVHLLIPLLGLVSRYPKRRRGFLWFWACWILVAHWIDYYWLIMPNLHGSESFAFGLLDILPVLGILAIFLAVALFNMRASSVVPVNDPALDDSLKFINV